MIKVERLRRWAGICGYKFLVRILSVDQMAGMEPNWICPRRDHVSSRPTVAATSLGCHNTNQRQTSLSLESYKPVASRHKAVRFRIFHCFEIPMKGEV